MGLAEIKSRITEAEAREGRASGSVKLIAVSKVQPLDRIEKVLDQGQRIFGENYVQEAGGKWPALKARYEGIELHMIGPLQTNKAKVAVELFDVIHSLDRPSLAETLAKLAGSRGKCPDLFVQVNTGSEPQKAGILPEQTDDFIAACRMMDLPVRGLMCIPPEDEHPSEHFTMLAKLAERNGLAELSMGMSSDFETAIAHGATHVRVGSALFGNRTY